ncbi:PepSY domain-containing protein [Mesorhizobium sp. SB112]|uniref:PepSY domain-containing protein n=1 Tax=Mesorhizobium sp. SB112 TaxID=3151853 RepID=UPI003266E98B
MKRLVFAAATIVALSTYGHAQETPAAQPETPAVVSPDEVNPSAPVEGANSFTEGQAKSRIEEAGFADVTELVKGDNGIWTSKARKDGKDVTVSLDYQGNVVAE